MVQPRAAAAKAAMAALEEARKAGQLAHRQHEDQPRKMRKRAAGVQAGLKTKEPSQNQEQEQEQQHQQQEKHQQQLETVAVGAVTAVPRRLGHGARGLQRRQRERLCRS